MELMTIDRQDSSKPVAFLEQGFDIAVLRSGQNPVEIRRDGEEFIVKLGRKRSKQRTSIKAVAKAQEWIGYENLMFHILYDESPD